MQAASSRWDGLRLAAEPPHLPVGAHNSGSRRCGSSVRRCQLRRAALVVCHGGHHKHGHDHGHRHSSDIGHGVSHSHDHGHGHGHSHGHSQSHDDDDKSDGGSRPATASVLVTEEDPAARPHTHDGGLVFVADSWTPRCGPLAQGEGRGQVLFLDGHAAGIAGDMLVAALLDLGVPPQRLADGLAGLQGLGGFRARVRGVQRSAIAAPSFEVLEDAPQPFRTYAEIADMLDQAGTLTSGARELAQTAFRLLAEAEAAVHGVDVASVHFHEVGAVDSIVDIVAAAIGVDYIGPTSTCLSPLPMGRGIIRGAAHGPLPCPAPATLAILCRCKIPTYNAQCDGELVTPTGACLAGAIASPSFTSATMDHPSEEWAPVVASAWPAIVPTRCSYGAGSRDRPDRPNLLRLVLGVPTAANSHMSIQTNGR